MLNQRKSWWLTVHKTMVFEAIGEKGQKSARVSGDSDKPPINRQELKELRIFSGKSNRSGAEGQIFSKDQMRRLDDDIRRLNQKG